MKEVDRQTERKARERKWEKRLPTVRTGWVRPRVRLTVGAGFLARLFMPASHSWDTSIPSTTGRHVFGERGGSSGQTSLDSTLSMAPVDGSLLQKLQEKMWIPSVFKPRLPSVATAAESCNDLGGPLCLYALPPSPNWHNHSHLRNTVAVHIRDRPNLWTLCRPNRPTAQESTAWTRAGHTALASALSSTLRQRTDSSARVQKWGPHARSPHYTARGDIRKEACWTAKEGGD